MKTTADIMSLANDYANADNVIDSAQKQQALRLAVESLVAERDTLRSAHEAIATLDHTRPLLDARTISRAALRGQS